MSRYRGGLTSLCMPSLRVRARPRYAEVMITPWQAKPGDAPAFTALQKAADELPVKIGLVV
ncbi:MAG: hypothetical protein V4772_03015 [Pseudomonadota bacterium]